MPTHRFILAVLAGLLAVLALPVPAGMAQEIRIAAVVNDDVISLADLNARIELVMTSSNIPDDPQIRRRVAAQVMRQMIDEKLEVQEAKKQGVTLSDQDIDNALSALEQQNNLPKGGLDKYLQEHHIDKAALVDQLTAQMLWARVVRRRYLHAVSIGDDEINDQIKEIEKNRNQPQNRVAEIFLSVDNPQQELEVRELAERLSEQLQHGGSFPQIARQFSQSPTAAVGGDIGWVLPGELDPSVEKIIDDMQPGMMTRPLRMAGGYYIYLLIERRPPLGTGADVTVDLSQVVFPLPEDADAHAREAVIARAQQATEQARSCGEMARIGKEVSPELSGPIGNVKVAELPAELRPMILAAEVAQPLKPVPVRGGIGVFMVCHREGGASAINRDEVGDNMLRARLENLARRYLADLRRVAYVDLRV